MLVVVVVLVKGDNDTSDDECNSGEDGNADTYKITKIYAKSDAPRP